MNGSGNRRRDRGGRRVRGRGWVLAAVLLATSAGLASAPAHAHTGPGPGPIPAKSRQADPLQRQVDAIHDTGTVGVLAESTAPDRRRTARAGTADLRTGKPVPRDGRFRIGSATKTFTATVVLQLVGEGRLSLDDTVEHWLPGVVRGNGNDGGRITVRQLLQHTSGIHDVLGDIPALNSADGFRDNQFRTYTPKELVVLAMRHAPNFQPGTDWSYSNTNYILAGMIINRVTGRSWAQEVNARIIRPLGLEHTSTPGTSPSIPGPHAHGYAAFGTDTALDVTEFNPSAVDASGSIISTTHDMSRFYRALIGGRLLPPAQLDAMTTTVPAPELAQQFPGARYGLGIGQLRLPCGGTYFAHPGEVPGYHTWGGVTPDATRTAVVSVTGDGNEHSQQAMSTLVTEELCRKGS